MCSQTWVLRQETAMMQHPGLGREEVESEEELDQVQIKVPVEVPSLQVMRERKANEQPKFYEGRLNELYTERLNELKRAASKAAQSNPVTSPLLAAAPLHKLLTSYSPDSDDLSLTQANYSASTEDLDSPIDNYTYELENSSASTNNNVSIKMKNLVNSEHESVRTVSGKKKDEASTETNYRIKQASVNSEIFRTVGVVKTKRASEKNKPKNNVQNDGAGNVLLICSFEKEPGKSSKNVVCLFTVLFNSSKSNSSIEPVKLCQTFYKKCSGNYSRIYLLRDYFRRMILKFFQNYFSREESETDKNTNEYNGVNINGLKILQTSSLFVFKNKHDGSSIHSNSLLSKFMSFPNLIFIYSNINQSKFINVSCHKKLETVINKLVSEEPICFSCHELRSGPFFMSNIKEVHCCVPKSELLIFDWKNDMENFSKSEIYTLSSIDLKSFCSSSHSSDNRTKELCSVLYQIVHVNSGGISSEKSNKQVPKLFLFQYKEDLESFHGDNNDQLRNKMFPFQNNANETRQENLSMPDYGPQKVKRTAKNDKSGVSKNQSIDANMNEEISSHGKNEELPKNQSRDAKLQGTMQLLFPSANHRTDTKLEISHLAAKELIDMPTIITGSSSSALAMERKEVLPPEDLVSVSSRRRRSSTGSGRRVAVELVYRVCLWRVCVTSILELQNSTTCEFLDLIEPYYNIMSDSIKPNKYIYI